MMRKVLSILLIISFQQIVAGQAAKDSYSSVSSLSSGEWFKVGILQDGIYRLTYSDIQRLGLSDPRNIKLFANNFGQLSYYTDDPYPDDLKEVATYKELGSDGVFNDGDYILFYGQGTGRWDYDDEEGSYRYRRHNYSDTAFYFITSGSSPSQTIGVSSDIDGTVNYSSSESDVLFIHEIEFENIIKSGREWYEPIAPSSSVEINGYFNNLVSDEPLWYDIRVLARSPSQSIFRLKEDNLVVKSLNVNSVNILNVSGIYAQITDSVGYITPRSTNPNFSLEFHNNGVVSANGWVDYVAMQGRRHNVFDGATFFFADSRSVAANRITRFSIDSRSTSPYVWDVTDAHNPISLSTHSSNNTISFVTTTDTLKRFVAFTAANILTPIIYSTRIDNQDLHGSEDVDMVIITHPLFKRYAEELAQIHLSHSGLSSLIVTPQQIYNEFSGGVSDIVAFRNFLRMKYMKQKDGSRPFKYLLLFGDGSYENRTPPPNNPNFIPTYQSTNSNVVVSSFVSDDFYTLLEDGEGEATGSEDIGVGRLPVSDTTEAGIIVRKIKSYLSTDNQGVWKKNVCFVADDEDSNTHLIDANNLASYLDDHNPEYDITKVFLDAYRQETSATGQSYPDAVGDINDKINSGCLVFNYSGHGNENGLAAERVVTAESINSWSNGTKLPLFITATCEFSRFDDADRNFTTHGYMEKSSAGERILLNERGGGIALMSTTRIVYSSPNYLLNKNIFVNLFNTDENGEPLRLGDVFRLAKNLSGDGTNKRNFSLLGDPALILNYPHHGDVITDSINGIHVTEQMDTLKALSRVIISGHIENRNGLTDSTFNGLLSVIVYDKEQSISTLANDGGVSTSFNVRENILFRGNTTVTSGYFKFNFAMPRDIDFNYGHGKISYYAYDGSSDMNGSFSDIVVGGFSESTSSDREGPQIRLFLNDTLFREGGITNSTPTLFATLHDLEGINASGSGIGHDIVCYIDGDDRNIFILNNYFENDFNSYSSGKIQYQLPRLTEGLHSITLKVWDNQNNSSTASIKFMVKENHRLVINKLTSYPNPSFNSPISFTAEHNRPDEELHILISIYDINGRIVKIIEEEIFTTGFQLPPIVWDGCNDNGARIKKGVYPYTMEIRTTRGDSAKVSSRIIIF